MLDNPGFAVYGSLVFGVISLVLNIATLWLFIRRPNEAVDCSQQKSGPSAHRERERLVEIRFTVTAVGLFFGQSVMAIYMVHFENIALTSIICEVLFFRFLFISFQDLGQTLTLLLTQRSTNSHGLMAHCLINIF